MADEYTISEITPEEEDLQRIEDYGPFAGASVDVDKVNKLVKVRIDDPLKGKDYIEFGTDVANAAAWIFNDVSRGLNESADKLKKSFGG